MYYWAHAEGFSFRHARAFAARDRLGSGLLRVMDTCAVSSSRDGLEPGTRAYDQRRGGRGKGQCREFSA